MVPSAIIPAAPSRTRLSLRRAVSSRSTVFVASRRSAPSFAGVGIIASAPFRSWAEIISTSLEKNLPLTVLAWCVRASQSVRSKPRLELPRNYNSFWSHLGDVGQCFDSDFDRAAKRAGVRRIDFIGGTKIATVAALNDKKHCSALTATLETHEGAQVFRGALAHRIREGGGATETERDVFYLDEAAAIASFQAEIEPSMPPDVNFAVQGSVAMKFFDDAGFNRFGGETVRMKGVDSNPITLNLDHLPGISKLAAFAFTAREINGAAGFVAAQHAAGIRAMGGDNFAGAQANIGEKTLVTLHQYPADQFRGEMHNSVYSETA